MASRTRPSPLSLFLSLSRAERVSRYAGDFMPVAGNIKSHLSTFYVDRLIISGKSCFFHSLSLSSRPVFVTPFSQGPFVPISRAFNTVSRFPCSRCFHAHDRENDRWWSLVVDRTIYKPFSSKPRSSATAPLPICHTCRGFFVQIPRPRVHAYIRGGK